MFKNVSLTAKLMVSVGTVGLIIFIATVSFITLNAIQLSKKQVRQRMDALAGAFANEIRVDIENAFDAARGLAYATRNMKKKDKLVGRDILLTMMEGILEKNPGFLGIWTVWEPNAFDEKDQDFAGAPGHTKEGRFVPYWNRFGGAQVHLEACVDLDGEWYTKSRDTQKEVIMDPFSYPLGGKTVTLLSVCVPIIVNGKSIGVAGVDFSMDQIAELVSHIAPYGTGYAVLTTGSGMITAHPDKEKVSQMAGDHYPPEINAALEAKETAHVDFFLETTGDKSQMTIIPFVVGQTGTHWYIMINAPLEKMLAGVIRMKNVNIMISVVSMVLLGLLVHFLFRLTKETAMRRQARDEAVRTREKFRIIVDYTYGVETWHDETGQLFWINRTAEQIIGYSAAECLAMSDFPLPIIAPEDRALTKRITQSGIAGKSGNDEVVRVNCKNGSQLWLSVSWNPVLKDDGGFGGFRVSCRDVTERMTAAQDLCNSEERLRFALETAGAFYWAFDVVHDVITYTSFKIFEQAGYNRNTAPKNTGELFSMIHPDDRAQVEKNIARHYSGDLKVMKVEYRMPRLNGDGWIWFYTISRAVERDEQGMALKTAGLTINVSEQRELFEQVQATQDRLRIISEHTYDWQAWYGLDGNLVWVNQAVERITGFSPDQCLAMTGYPRPLIDDRDVDLFLKHNDLALQGAGRQELAVRIRRRDKAKAWVFMSLDPVFDDNGRVMGIASICKDISSQKQAERELNLMSRIFENTADPIQILDLSYRIMDVNQATVDAYGYSRQELLGEAISIIVPDENFEQGKQLLNRCLAGEVVRDVECRRRKRNGKIVPVLLTFSLLHNDDGKPIGLASITKDISKLKEAEQALKDYKGHLEALVKERTADLANAMRMAEDATRAKSQFLANMSHEIRTPLNAVIGFAHLALQTALDDIQFDYLNKIQNSSRVLLGLINDILDFSKIEAGKLGMETIEFNLEDVLDNVTTLVGGKAQEKGLEVIFDVDPALPWMLMGDPLRLGQVLINLTNNAVKFTETGEIILGCTVLKEDDRQVTLQCSVQDSGIGMSDEQQAGLFQVFSQADNSTTRQYGGTGLGLVISKFLVEMMKGRIWVESRPGEGATFFFTIRLKKAGTGPDFTVKPGDALYRSKILVVDGNDTCRTVISSMLEAMSFKVIQADSAQAGLAALGTHAAEDPFKLVLMEWQMPGMDGLQAFRQVRDSLNLSVPVVIMVSAYAREELIQQAAPMALDGYLVKPVSPFRLFNTIRVALGGEALPGMDAKRSDDGLIDIESIKGATVLVAEDNEINQQVARGILEKNGLVVEMANNGQLAVAAVRKKAYDAVLMDIHMPQMDGYTACREIRRDDAFKDLPIIAMTASAMAGDREKALASGMNDHVAKPINVQELLGALCRWIKKPHQVPEATSDQ